ncbi:class C sortase [Corynebacterium sp. 32222D000AT]|uniref:Sortase family protein, LPXTG-site transpeptidase n=1 Tax=Corynebacterium camporealensis TaxID=161896 RepID=A0A0F6QWZ4_9CORY|nr:class C sortase [Corynebacterium camporealensis]AKE39707.1 sortase family protein, LPXTG-site transpeptidase [Corynebacterium camporealensis]AVH88833.1 Sortase A, LPXTG specific [Corynebacterium camporealensis]MDY5839703.1 class C sortase [Corynebacterium camporealensis]
MANSTKVQRPPRKRRRSLWLILAGILLLLYPIVATQINDYNLQKQAELYEDSVRQIDPPSQREQYLREAEEYNEWLAGQGHHAYPPLPGSPGYERYMQTLDAPETHGVIARLRIPSIEVDLPVYHTTAPDVLYDGAGHMFGSSLPVGGEGNNAVLSAHTGMVDASMFDNLPRLKDGEIVSIEVMGRVLHYKVTGREVVAPDDYEAVEYVEGEDRLTLITCTPYGINTDRLLVHAERVYLGNELDDGGWVPKLSWWMIAALIVIALVLLIVAWNEYRRKRRARAAKEAREASEEAE